MVLRVAMLTLQETHHIVAVSLVQSVKLTVALTFGL